MTYGQTEVGPVSSLLDIDRLGYKRHSAGQAPPQFEVVVVDENERALAPGMMGEIVLRPREPDVMFKGYWNKPQATVDAFSNLWFHTGDLGSLDEEGYLVFHGRKTDSMRRRGENVSAYEVESAIQQHDRILSVAVHAVPSDLGEDEIKACIVLVPGAMLEPAELFAFLREALPYFAVPRYVEIMEALPVTAATNRVMKHELVKRGVADSWDFEKLGLRVQKSERRGRAASPA
jgi:crotonobetaine/carnitine-CoA ligase